MTFPFLTFMQMTLVLASNSPPAAFKPPERYDRPPPIEKTSPVKNFAYEEKKRLTMRHARSAPDKIISYGKQKINH